MGTGPTLSITQQHWTCKLIDVSKQPATHKRASDSGANKSKQHTDSWSSHLSNVVVKYAEYGWAQISRVLNMK